MAMSMSADERLCEPSKPGISPTMTLLMLRRVARMQEFPNSLLAISQLSESDYFKRALPAVGTRHRSR
jgi:hypothetical protein